MLQYVGQYSSTETKEFEMNKSFSLKTDDELEELKGSTFGDYFLESAEDLSRQQKENKSDEEECGEEEELFGYRAVQAEQAETFNTFDFSSSNYWLTPEGFPENATAEQWFKPIGSIEALIGFFTNKAKEDDQEYTVTFEVFV